MNLLTKKNIFDPPLPSEKKQLYWRNLQGSSVGLALTSAIIESERPLIIIAPDSLAVSHLIDEIHFFGNHEIPLWQFPDWETLPYDHFSPHQDIISERLEALFRLPTLSAHQAVLTTISTLMHRLPPKNFLAGHHFLLKVGDILDADKLKLQLISAGYYSVGQVQEHGEFAIRGSLIDLFPMGSRTPFRIDLFDNVIDSIRLFSPETQRSLEKILEIRLLPAKEFPLTENAIEQFRQNWRRKFSGDPLKSSLYQEVSEGICTPGIEYYLSLFFDQTDTFFDYLPENAVLVTVKDVEAKAKEFWHEIETRYNQAQFDISRPILSPSDVFIPPERMTEKILEHPSIHINNRGDDNVIDFHTETAPALDVSYKSREPLAPLQQFIQKSPDRILFCAESMGRREIILQLFKSISLHPTVFSSWQEFLASQDKQGMVVAPLEQGFVLRDPPLTLLTETQLYGKRVMQRRLRKKISQDPDALIKDLTELQVNDPIVHLEHGIGRYRGLNTLTVGDQVAEFLCLEYQDEAKLYVPVSSLHLVSRYMGADVEHIQLNKLGTDQWQRTKRKAAEKVRDVAAELLDLYARRASRPGHAFKIPEEYETFAASFPFEETPDQLNAIEQVFQDMTSDKAMDRVICGDVGFGKTEVAMRAAFLAVENNTQVVLLVPTTLLAQQHLENFQDRFANLPVQIEMLSRFRTAKQQKDILQRAKEGKIDIVIGTHKLLQKEIEFKSLGLVIIDEEHRFGVKQKEKLKSLRTLVDILTLTATPIPRTLNMALAGIRDLSVIATPPARRLSVKTFIHEYDNHLIQEAIQREILRGGQVYFLHNEITSIQKKMEDLSKLVPEARIAVAHGQMHERDLERIMSQFYHRYFNVLVCSTIIESGIDIPTANTIIINRADKFGIAQLHQLRGRVGRSHHQAYAYLLIPSRKYISNDAVKRLDAISALDELGIGFTLSTHDLEIRGAGELLGEEQSGDMQEIGFSLYMDLLSRAVEALKTGKEPDLETSLLQPAFEIDLHLTALIPELYINDVQIRLQFYKRIANAKTERELDEIQVELIDRFGLLPAPVKNLFALSELKLKAQTLGILKLEANEKGGKIEFSEKPSVNPARIIELIQNQSLQFKLDGPTRLRFTLPEHETKDRVELVNQILQLLS